MLAPAVQWYKAAAISAPGERDDGSLASTLQKDIWTAIIAAVRAPQTNPGTITWAPSNRGAMRHPSSPRRGSMKDPAGSDRSASNDLLARLEE